MGQGAFYSERFVFSDGSKPFTVVYDCGSGKGIDVAECAKSELEHFITTVDEIDLLFISHFHKDHFNGIKMLLDKGVIIKNVIMPYMDNELRDSLSLLHERIREVTDDTLFADPLKLFNGDTSDNANHDSNSRKIFVVSNKDVLDKSIIPPSEFEPKTIYTDENDSSFRFIDISKINQCSANDDMYLNSGHCILLDIVDWIFMPFTREDNDNDENLKNKIQELKSTLDRYEQKYGHEWIAKPICIEKVKEIYKGIENNINNTSMLMFSAPLKSSLHKFHRIMSCPESDIASCLYTGDISLSPTICELITNKLCGYTIGSFQVPHHGSKNGWSNKVPYILWNIDVDTKFFLSHGTANSYGHPNQAVSNDFGINHFWLRYVNEFQYTKHIQNYNIKEHKKIVSVKEQRTV